MAKNEENWLANYEALKEYIDEHHHLPSKDAPLGAEIRPRLDEVLKEADEGWIDV